MAHTIVFDFLPVGYAEEACPKGKKTVRVSHSGFYSSEDGDQLITRLEGIPQQILSLIRTDAPISPGRIGSMLAIIKKDKTGQVYLNEDVKAIGHVRIKRSCQKGEALTANDVLDTGKLVFDGIDIPNDVGVVFVFSVGWRRGFFYDLAPLHGSGAREFDLSSVLGGLHSYLSFQHRFRITKTTWDKLFAQKWFPFNYLDDTLLKDMIKHAEHSWNVDDLLPRITDNVKRILKEANPIRKENPYLAPHIELLDKATERYLEDDHVSCAAILYPRIEGILRTFHKEVGSSEAINSKTLPRVTVEHHHGERIPNSMLLPDRFLEYLSDVYFQKYKTGSDPDVARHSVAHGEARAEDFNVKSSTIALLIVFQLTLFFSGNKT